MRNAFRSIHLNAAANYGPAGGKGSFARLGNVEVTTSAAAAVITIYDGQDATGTVVAVIDASVKGHYAFDCLLKNGIFAVVSGSSAAHATLTYE